jgi:putative ABC transport system permease protein
VLEGRELVRAGRMIVLGVGVGLPGAWLAGRTFGAALYGVTPLAPDVLVPVGALLAGAAFLAAWIPVHRATRVDPVEALRAE